MTLSRGNFIGACPALNCLDSSNETVTEDYHVFSQALHGVEHGEEAGLRHHAQRSGGPAALRGPQVVVLRYKAYGRPTFLILSL